MSKKRLAIIGSGISGLTVAYLTHKHFDITLFESEQRLGGHTATVDVTYDGVPYTIDTGFIVFNEHTYPNFNRLLQELGIKKTETWMGFGVSNEGRSLEYNTSTFTGFFAQRRNLFSIGHWYFLYEILRFNRLAKKKNFTKSFGENETLRTFVNTHNFSKRFIDSYLVPLTSIVWSQDHGTVLDIPLEFFVTFFNNHGLFSKSDILRWFVVEHNSRSYIEPLIRSFSKSIRLSSAISSVSRGAFGACLTFQDGSEEWFDEVVFATHSDQALQLLSDASSKETEILSSIPYTTHEVVLHTDNSVLPQKKHAWEAWNICVTKETKVPIFTYNMNMLQQITAPVTFCVTLDPEGRVDAKNVLFSSTYSHPQFTKKSIEAQKKWGSINGIQHTYYAGAYWRNGFHEDGVWSGIRVAKKLGVDLDIFSETFKE